MSKETYEVLKVEGKSGLTIGSHVLAPGRKFTREAWPYSEEKLKKAVETKRCKKISDGNKNGDNDKLKKEYQKLSEKLVNLKVGKDDKAIENIESKMKEIEDKLS